jgi:hypothetical protein
MLAPPVQAMIDGCLFILLPNDFTWDSRSTACETCCARLYLSHSDYSVIGVRGLRPIAGVVLDAQELRILGGEDEARRRRPSGRSPATSRMTANGRVSPLRKALTEPDSMSRMCSEEDLAWLC